MAKPKVPHIVTERGHVEIDGHDYSPGDRIPATVAVPKWLRDQGYCQIEGDR